MSNAFYEKSLDGFAIGEFNWQTDPVDLYLVRTDVYTVDLANDEFVGDIPPAARPDLPSSLSAKSVSGGGIADAADTPFTNNDPNEKGAVVLATGSGATSPNRLIAYIDTAPGLPTEVGFGGTLIVQWDAQGIFKLG